MNITNLPHACAVFTHDNLEELSAAVAQRIAALAAQAIAAHGVFHIVLAGGETPCLCYEKLRELAIEWMHVQIYFGDERCLPSGDANRNDAMVRETLLKHINIPETNIHSIPAQLGAQQAAANYAALLANIKLDLVLLGMGEDGHTASLFPNNPATESPALVVPVFNAPKPPAERVSLGINTLNAAQWKIFLVTSAKKWNALEQILRGKSLPAARVVNAEWHFDRAVLPNQ